MTRLHADPVEVRTRAEAGGPVPEQFLWRGRLYLVREVLARWTSTGPWWRDAGTAGSRPTGEARAAEAEQDWWRVEAGSGRLAVLSAGAGVYDLCFSWSTGTWTVERVLD